MDRVLLTPEEAAEALAIGRCTVYDLIRDKLPEERAADLARLLTQGTWTHDYPIDVEQLKAFGLTVRTDLPMEVYELMRLYPQPAQRRPSVEYIPMPYHPPASPQPPARPAPPATGRRVR